MLAHGDENYVYHARKSVQFYEQLLSYDPDDEDYKSALKESQEFLAAAQEDVSRGRAEEDTAGEGAAEEGAAEAVQSGQRAPGEGVSAGPRRTPRSRKRTDSRYLTVASMRTAASDRPNREVKKPERYGANE